MAGEQGERRLAAILAADVAGYSRLMGADEEGTLAELKALRASRIDPKIKEHRGNIVKTTGDGVLAEFASAVDAVRSAEDIQRGVAEHNAGVHGDRRMELRIGINVGDVIFDDGDVFGDGVNIAARLQTLAIPGAICLSESVYAQVRDKVALGDVRDMGEHQLKNIARLVRVYGLRGGGAPAQPPLALPDKPSIAVLPLANLSGDPEQQYLIDGIAEEIITSLSKVRWLFVIARNSSFTYRDRNVDLKQVARDLGVRYVVAGSVRRAADRIRVSCQLVDGSTGGQVWAKSYDHAVADVFALQDEITRTIVGAIEPEVGRAERERAKLRKPENLDAWTTYQRGMAHLYRGTQEDLAEARRLLEQAIALDPNLGPAYSGVAEVYYYEVVYGFAQSPQENRDKAIGPAQRAVTLDPEDASAHCTLGRIRYLRRDYAAAIAELQIALDINPSLALAHYGMGAALVFSGKATQALPHLEAAIRLSPHDPNMGSFLVRIAEAKFLLGDNESAVTFALKSLSQTSLQWSRYAVLIAALGELGRIDEAARHLEEVRRFRPTFSIEFVRNMHPFGADFGIERYCDGLRKAGVAERAQ